MRPHFALARLLGLRNEAYVVSAWVVLTVACYFAALFPPRLWILAIPIAVIAIQLPVSLAGTVLAPLLARSEKHLHVNGFVFMALMIGASAIIAAGTRWQHYVADAFLALVIANLIAAGIERCGD